MVVSIRAQSFFNFPGQREREREERTGGREGSEKRGKKELSFLAELYMLLRTTQEKERRERERERREREEAISCGLYREANFFCKERKQHYRV